MMYAIVNGSLMFVSLKRRPLTGINMRKEPQGTNEIASSGREASVTAVIDTSISGSELQADIKGKALWGAPCPGKASG